MRIIYFCLMWLAPGLVAIAAPIPSGAVAIGPRLNIEFVTPGNWRCAPDATQMCATCQNLSGQVGEIAVRCDSESPPAHRSVLPGEELSICCAEPSPV
jgi:hypothetical protein